MERICAICGNTIVIDENNSNRAIQYKKKFYHFDCFETMCDQKIANKRKDVSDNWTHIKSTIEELVDATTKEQKVQVVKDQLSRWLLERYMVSFLNSRVYMKLNDVYNGTLKGMAYPISPMELFDEWKYYWDELCAIRRNKAMTGEAALNYDLAILLSRNVEYRQTKEKEKIAMEIRKQQMEDKTVVQLTPKVKTKWQPKNKVADLYKEMNGGEGNE